MVVNFLMPQPIGLKSAANDWWKVASDMGLDKRFALTLQDMTNGQRTTIYVYFRTIGYAPAPDYPFLSEFIANGIGLGSVTQINGVLDVRKVSVGPFALSEESSVEASTFVVPGSGSDPYVFANVSIGARPNYFACCQYTATYLYPMIPQNRLYAHLVISGQANGDPYVDQLTVQVAGSQVLTANVQGSFTFERDVSGLLVDTSDQINSVYIAITTATGSWGINAQFNIEYSASQQWIKSGGSVFAANRIFQNSGHGVNTFNAFVPSGISAAIMYFQLTDNGDPSCRVFDVSVQNVEITPSGGKTYCPDSQGHGVFYWNSNDLTGLLAYNDHVQTMVMITTFGTSYNWMLWAYLNTNARYKVWTDNNPAWNTTDHPIEQASMNFYDTTITANLAGHFLTAPSIELKTTEKQKNYPIWIGVTEHIPSWVQTDYANQCPIRFGCILKITNEIHVSTLYQGSYLTSDRYQGSTGYSSPNTNSGTDQNGVSSDILAIIAAAASLVPGGGPAAATAAIASVLIKYVQQSNQPSFSFGLETNGFFLKDYNYVSNDLSDLLVLAFTTPGPGIYTVNVTVTTAIIWSYTAGNGITTLYTLSSQIYYLSTYYNN
jgi:hypothetical protein